MAKQPTSSRSGNNYATTASNPYKQDRVPFVSTFQNRGSTATQDQRFVNCFPEKTKDQSTEFISYFIQKRAGLDTLNQPPAAAAVGRGCYYYEGNLYSCFGNKIYKGTSAIQTISTSTGSVGWAEATGTTKYLFFCDGTDAYVITTAGSPTKVTDVDFPTPHIAQPVFLNGYIFIVNSSTGDLHNCVVEDPTNWVATDIINPEMFPDDTVGLGKMSNQLVAFGRSSAEYFYDAANASGSPLNRSDIAAIRVGCASKDTIQYNEKVLIWVGKSDLGGRSIWRIDGFQSKKISYEGIDRVLDAEGANISNAKAFMLRVQGHFFYVLNLTSRTFVYDIEEDSWHEWSTNNSGSHSKFACSYATYDTTAKPVLQHDSNGYLYNMNPATYTDNGTNILVQIITMKLDFGNYNNKFLHELELISDLTSASSTVTVKWSDDDYKNWSSGVSIDLLTRPRYTRLGSFRRRAFDVSHADNAPFRAEGLEVRYSTGIH